MTAITPDLMKRLLRRHDLIYERAPLQWMDGVPIANGNMGAVIWGDGRPLRLTLDHYGVWETRAPWPGDDPEFNYANLRRLFEAGHIEELEKIALRRRNQRFTDKPPPHPTRLSLGRLELQWPQPPSAFGARLDLCRARATGSLTFARGQATFSCIVDSTGDILLLDIRCDPNVPLPEVKLRPAATDAYSRQHFRSWKYPPPKVIRTGTRQVLTRRYSVGKAYSIVADERRSTRRLTVSLSIVTGTKVEDTTTDALRQLAVARQRGVVRLRHAHEADWQRFWLRSAIVLPDGQLENLYYAEMYKHYCSSRPGPGHIPITLQGLWTTDGAWPPWRGSYTTDMNVQQSYWPIYTANQLESAKPLYDMYWRNLPAHRKLGTYFYGREIAIITGEHGPGGEPFPGFFTDEHSPGAGAWIAHHFWLHWQYSRDRRFLRERTYPFLKEMVQAYLHIIEKRADGKYHIPFTDSPEFYCGRPNSLGNDNNYDLALLRFLLESLIEARKELKLREPDRAHWADVLKNLIPYAVVPTGLHTYEVQALSVHEPIPDWQQHGCLAIRPGLPLPHTHRHHSHLIGIYPLGVIDPERSAAERRLVEGSLDDIVFKGVGEWGAFSFPWAAMIAGRSGNALMAYRYLRGYLDGFVMPNSFNSNTDYRNVGFGPPRGVAMTLEAGFAAAAAVLEILLQSHHNLIRVFPTCPSTWGDAQFVSLRAEGAFIVSARMANYQVQFVEIASEVGGPCRVANPFTGTDVTLTDLDTDKARRLTGEILTFRTRRGGRYRLTPPAGTLRKKDLEIRLPPRPAQQRNWFGLKEHARF